MAQALTEERKVAWRIQGIGPDPTHPLVIFRKVGQAKILHKTLRPGEVFKLPIFTSADSFEAYAISTDENLRHEFSRKYLSGTQTWLFTLHFRLHFRVEYPDRLGLSLSGGDPLERLQEEVASLLSATARRFSWEMMKEEGEDIGLRLREAETTDGQGERRTNFHRLQGFASDLGLELQHLDVLRSLTESYLEDEKSLLYERRKLAASSDQWLAVEFKSHALSHEKLVVVPENAVIQEMERLRRVLDTINQEGSHGVLQLAGDIRSLSAMHDVLNQLQGIQASLAALSADSANNTAPDADLKAHQAESNLTVSPLLEEDPIWALGSNPVTCGAPDASSQPDRYLYGFNE